MNGPQPTTTCQRGVVCVDPASSGPWNMAVDQALLEQCERTGTPFLRFYHWSPPTLSLGYFQNYASRRDHEPSCSIPVVRRSTGGGAIVHDRELTYSLIVPNRGRWSRLHEDLMECVHSAIMEAIRDSFGAPVGFARDVQHENEKTVGHEPFLCFLRRHPLDVVLGGDKIVGSAQRRARGALLQHGSILLAQSPFAPELPGLGLADFDIAQTSDFRQKVMTLISLAVGIEFQPVSKEFADGLWHQQVEAIARCRFASRAWTQRR